MSALGFEAERRKASTDWLLVAIPGLIWGASFLFIAEGLEAVGPNGVAFARLAIGFATLSLFPGSWKPVARADLWRVALVAILWMAFPLTLFPYAEQRVSSAITGMLNAAVPLFAAIVATIIARRAPPRGVMIGLIVGLTGAAMMALTTVSEGKSSGEGVLLILMAVASYGVALNITAPLQQKYGALPVIWRAQMAAVVMTAPLGLPDVLSGRWSMRPALALLALGMLGTGIAYILLTTAAGRVGATRASSTNFIIPPVALMLGVLVRNERVAPLSVAGAAVCVVGAWLMHRARSRTT